MSNRHIDLIQLNEIFDIIQENLELFSFFWNRPIQIDLSYEEKLRLFEIKKYKILSRNKNIRSTDCQPIVADWCQNGTSNGLADSKQTYCDQPQTFIIVIGMLALLLFIMSWNINKNLIDCRNRYFSR